MRLQHHWALSPSQDQLLLSSNGPPETEQVPLPHSEWVVSLPCTIQPGSVSCLLQYCSIPGKVLLSDIYHLGILRLPGPKEGSLVYDVAVEGVCPFPYGMNKRSTCIRFPHSWLSWGKPAWTVLLHQPKSSHWRNGKACLEIHPTGKSVSPKTKATFLVMIPAAE